eukprot:3265200-Pyramimonas_sp.AAC.1
MECTPEERRALDTLHEQLKGVKTDLTGKEAEIKAWLDNARKMQNDITDRLRRKKRKGDDGQAAAAEKEAKPEVGASAPTDTAPTATAQDAEASQAAAEKIESEAKKLSEA